MHLTLGNGEYNLFQRMTEPVVCAQAVMHPQNVAMETERLIAEALYGAYRSESRNRRKPLRAHICSARAPCSARANPHPHGSETTIATVISSTMDW
jgi:TPP-dependent 2-oxoacid decarboxylase